MRSLWQAMGARAGVERPRAGTRAIGTRIDQSAGAAARGGADAGAPIQTLLQTLTGLQLSVGAIVAASQRVAERAAPDVHALGQAIRASPVVHLDETGWRQNVRNGFVWTASTSQHRWFVHSSRQKAMVDELLFVACLVGDIRTREEIEEGGDYYEFHQ